MKHRSVFPVLFSIVMMIFVAFLLWYIPAVSSLRFTLNDKQQSLETSQGRERKQQYEYNQTVEAIPETEAELERVLPLCEEAQEKVRELKKERKALRNEKKELEKAASSEQAGVNDDE